MKISVKLTKEEIKEALIEFLLQRDIIDTANNVEITFDIEPPCNSHDPREYSLGGLRSATITEK